MNPYLIHGPALISFSGGRSSAYMLRKILDAGLQADVHVVFANTGKEREETLEFVSECATRWGATVRWLEYRRTRLPRYESPERETIVAAGRRDVEYLPPGKEPGFVEVDFATASRRGEPFENLMDLSGVPNPNESVCTGELKIRVMKKFMLSLQYDHWSMVLGIRADEPRRIARLNAPTKQRWEHEMPLVAAGVDVAEVSRFWSEQEFDLRIRSDEGNCDLCFKKDPATLARLVAERPDSVEWWLNQERRTGQRFLRFYRSYADLKHESVEAGDARPCHCGD